MKHEENSEKIKEEIINKFEKLNTSNNVLFDVINYNTVDDLDNFISKLTEEQALYCLIESVKCSHRRGVFSLEETETISKAIRVLTK